MAKKPKKSDIEKIINLLPSKDRAAMREREITREWLEDNIKYRKGLMNRDFWIGLPWFVAYSVSLFVVGVNNLTIAIFVIGVVYFLYTIFTTGTYGQNRKRVQVYEELLKRFKK